MIHLKIYTKVCKNLNSKKKFSPKKLQKSKVLKFWIFVNLIKFWIFVNLIKHNCRYEEHEYINDFERTFNPKTVLYKHHLRPNYTKHKDVKTLEQEGLSFYICSSSLAYFNRFKVTFPQKIYNSRSDAEKMAIVNADSLRTLK